MSVMFEDRTVPYRTVSKTTHNTTSYSLQGSLNYYYMQIGIVSTHDVCMLYCTLCLVVLHGYDMVLLVCNVRLSTAGMENITDIFFLHIKHTTVYEDPWKTITDKMVLGRSIVAVLSD